MVAAVVGLAIAAGFFQMMMSGVGIQRTVKKLQSFEIVKSNVRFILDESDLCKEAFTDADDNKIDYDPALAKNNVIKMKMGTATFLEKDENIGGDLTVTTLNLQRLSPTVTQVTVDGTIYDRHLVQLNLGVKSSKDIAQEIFIEPAPGFAILTSAGQFAECHYAGMGIGAGIDSTTTPTGATSGTVVGGGTYRVVPYYQGISGGRGYTCMANETCETWGAAIDCSATGCPTGSSRIISSVTPGSTTGNQGWSCSHTDTIFQCIQD